MNGVINQTGSLPDPCPLTPGRLIIKYRQIFKVNRKKQGGRKIRQSEVMDLYLCTDSSVCVYESPTDTYASHTMYTTAEKHTPPGKSRDTRRRKKKKDDGFVSRKYAMLTTNEINTPGAIFKLQSSGFTALRIENRRI